MVKSKNLHFIVILISLVFTFISCDKDKDEWRSGKITYPATIPVPPSGIVSYTCDIGYEWIKLDGNIKNSSLDDFRYVRGGYIDIYGGPYIHTLTFRLENSNVVLSVDVFDNEGGILRDSEPQVREFLNAIVELIRRNNYARVYVDGNANGQIEIDFHIYLDAYVIY